MKIIKRLFLFGLLPIVVIAMLLSLTGILPRLDSACACTQLYLRGFRPIASEPTKRFLGKVGDLAARCRGGSRGEPYRATPWVDWANYYGTGDGTSLARDITGWANHRGVNGALMDLEYQRMELLGFNLFDNMGSFEDYIRGKGGKRGDVLTRWPAMRLPESNPAYAAVGGADEQVCKGDLVRYRTLSGICNDVRNPLMGATGTLFSRNVRFEETSPELSDDPYVKNRHGDRLALLKPDPQVISRMLFTRQEHDTAACRQGMGAADGGHSDCDYKKAPFFNVLAAFWIQFMTHDWFSHLEEGHNSAQYMPVGCQYKLIDGKQVELTPEEIQKLGCRPADAMEKALAADTSVPAGFESAGHSYLKRARKTARNGVTAWWDASQIYGYDETSVQRVKRDPADRAKLLMEKARTGGDAGDAFGYLPLLAATDPMNPAWAGQEATGFPDNWNIGLSFYHTLFAREHNLFVDEFRKRAKETPDADCGLRNPARADQAISYKQASDEEIYQAGRLVVSAEIAKIHTTEWTTQLLYDEPLYRGMNANWNGFAGGNQEASKALADIAAKMAQSGDKDVKTGLYSVVASGAGIFGLGSHADGYKITDPNSLMGGVNHFGCPFNFPEEFPTVYRLHPLVPDFLELRDWKKDANKIVARFPVGLTFRNGATKLMRDSGIAEVALSMGRQRLGLLALQNHPHFLQNLPMPRLAGSPTKTLDVTALDIIRDRERGIPRFNEFRRQIGLKTLTGFDDFRDRHPLPEAAVRDQEKLVGLLREVYGQHACDDSKVITRVQLNDRGDSLTDCLGHPNGTMVDNIEDVDVVVGMLAETTRPHGFAISETQFHVFILNASRRLFSDRFFTSGFRPEFYSSLGVAWVNDNGPSGKLYEPKPSNTHKVEISPLKRILLRAIPELAPELEQVVNAFDPWARDRGEYYSLAWKPRPGAEGDESFASAPAGAEVSMKGEAETK